ncbi:MAG: hypothetical protein K6G22_10020 [Lachnospiraceae bacterium]|nr:hypothetical protein [Lachnospiraceae bacterium]
MRVEDRIRRCLILEKMRKNETAAKELGLKNISKIRTQQKCYGESKGR